MPNIDGEPTFAEWLEESDLRLSDALTVFLGIKRWPKKEGALKERIEEAFYGFINKLNENENAEPFEIIVESLAEEHSETYIDYLSYLDDLRAEAENGYRDMKHQTDPSTRNGGLR